MFLMSPPKRVLFQNLILLEILSSTPSFIVSKSQSIFLKQSVDSRDTSVPTVF